MAMWIQDQVAGLPEHQDLERNDVVKFIPQSRVVF